jgi:molecular chaperone DnaJ
MKDYYRILRVPRDATMSEIRQAYHERARATHPDVSGSNDHDAFLDVQEAWETLGQPATRGEYDRTLARDLKEPNVEFVTPTRYAGYRPVDSLLAALWRSASDGILHQLRDGPPAYEVLLEPEEAEQGVEVSLAVPTAFWCPRCAGTGRHFIYLCHACGGGGVQHRFTPLVLRVPPGFRGTHVVEIPLGRTGFPDETILVRFRRKQ